MAGRFAVLIGIDADAQLARGARRFEYAESGGARGVEDHVHALVVHGQRHLLAASRIAKRFGGHAGVVHDHVAVGADVLHTGPVAGFELVNERDVHAAHEADLLGFAHQCRQRTDQERTLLFTELERHEIGRHRPRGAHAVGGHGVVDVGEFDVRIFLRQQVDVVGEDEADGDHQIHALSGQQSQAGLTIGAFARLDVAHARAQRFGGAHAAKVGSVVERLIAATADIEDDADVEAVGAVGDRRSRRVDGQQDDVGEEERPDEVKGPAHEDEGSPDGAAAGRGNAPLSPLSSGWRRPPQAIQHVAGEQTAGRPVHTPHKDRHATGAGVRRALA